MSRSRLRRTRIAAVAVLIASLPGAWLTAPAAQAAAPTPDAAHAVHRSADTGPAVRHDTSKPLRTLAAAAAHGPHGHHKKKEQDDGEERLPHPPASPIPDPVVQSSPGGPSAPSTGTNFEGIGAGNYSITGVPPDPNAAVGTGQIVETVNTARRPCGDVRGLPARVRG
jgi:hypothetical protein